MHKWYKTYKGDFFNLEKAELIYIDTHCNPGQVYGIAVEARSDYDDLWHVFVDSEPVSKGYTTEEEARDVLQKFMSNLNFYDVSYFMEN